MKLKPIVASMLVLVSGPVLAATVSDNANTQAQLDAMKANVAKLQAIVEQNQPGGFQQPDNWWNRITLSGQAIVDGIASSKGTVLSSSAGSVSSRTASSQNPFGRTQSNQFQLTTANLYTDANVSDYTKAHLDMAYQTPGTNMDAPIDQSGVNQTHNYLKIQPMLNEGYAILGNFNKYPFYLMAGLQNVAFGEYDVYPMTYSFTQLLSQTKTTAATVGYVDACTGFNAAVFGFHGLNKTPAGTQTPNSRINNFGAKVGIKNNYDNWGYGLAVDWLNNLSDVDYVKTSNSTDVENPTTGGLATYGNRVGGLAVDGDLVGGPFDAKVRYVQAMNHFASADVPRYSNSTLQATGAKPWAATIDLGYGFNIWQHQSRVALGYGQTGQAAGVGARGLSQNHYEGQYVVNVSRYTDLGVDVYYDNDYSQPNGGSGKGATTGILRLGVKFA